MQRVEAKHAKEAREAAKVGIGQETRIACLT